jgi:hypothetical protein
MIYSWSKFNYGHTITNDNQNISFKEGVSTTELFGVIAVGNYTLGEFAQAVQDALNSAGTLTYTVSLNRGNNKLTVAASGNFKLLCNTGTVASTSAWELMGFSTAADKTGAATYLADNASGSEYYPQFMLQSYVPPGNFVESVEATVNESADGRVEVVRFGTRNMIEMDIKFITNKTMDGSIIRNNPTGLADALDFFNYVSQKKKFEFVPDVTSTSTYHKVILEKFPGNSNGTGFKLRELLSENLPDFYETGVMTLRVVT